MRGAGARLSPRSSQRRREIRKPPTSPGGTPLREGCEHPAVRYTPGVNRQRRQTPSQPDWIRRSIRERADRPFRRPALPGIHLAPTRGGAHEDPHRRLASRPPPQRLSLSPDVGRPPRRRRALVEPGGEPNPSLAMRIPTTNEIALPPPRPMQVACPGRPWLGDTAASILCRCSFSSGVGHVLPRADRLAARVDWLMIFCQLDGIDSR